MIKNLAINKNKILFFLFNKIDTIDEKKKFQLKEILKI